MRVGGHFDFALLDDRPGQIIMRIAGKGVHKLFKNEAGGHRWQRQPPNDKRGRVHTSTITVAVLPELSHNAVEINKKDIEIRTTYGHGPGGQNRNKRDTCVVLTHKPSGITVTCQTKSQHHNKVMAMEILEARLANINSEVDAAKRNSSRSHQVGRGMRGDKRRTISVRQDKVTDHVTNKTISYKKYMRGHIEGLCR